MSGSRDSGSELAVLDAQIARAQARVDELDHERGRLERDLAALRERRDGIARVEAASCVHDAPSGRSAAGKVALSVAVCRAQRRLPEALAQPKGRSEGLLARLQQRVGPGRLRQAARQVRRVVDSATASISFCSPMK